MSSPYSRSLFVAGYLATLWSRHKSRPFIKTLAEDFGYETARPPCFERVYIAEISNGNAQKGEIGNEVTQWWIVDDAGLREVEVEGIEFEAQGDFYKCPVLKFHIDGEWVATGEKLGPRISIRRTGCIVESSDGARLQDVKTIWTQSTLGKK